MNVNCIIIAQFTIMQLCLCNHVYVNKCVTVNVRALFCWRERALVCCKRVYVNKGARCYRARLNVN
ncbi:hypothetical protein [Caudoviricetes sp.]|nr:hypothetical protein [Caudoviricetes sp.]